MQFKACWALASASFLFSIPLTANAALYDTVIQTKYGPVQGYPAFNSSPTDDLTHWKDITVWKGIPFAATTAGQNRFKPPQPAQPWNTTLYAQEFGDICPSATEGDTNFTISEDCLNLNIWSAANSTDEKLPVVMWSYPAASTAADALFNGWLAHPELSAEMLNATGHNSSGNWGMLDQFAALKWIHNNIADFGGDPDHITVMGQSAGSAATYHIVNSPLTKGLIVGAIIESGVRDPHDPLDPTLAEGYTTLNVSLETGVEYLASLNVSTIAELRELPMDDLETSQSSDFSFTATLDHYAMPSTYLDTLINGPANDVPILTGNTKDESGATYGLNISLATYLSDLNSTYSGEWVEEFLEYYPANDSVTASGAYNSQFTDRSKVGTWLWSRLWVIGATSPVYTYFWDHAPPGQDQGAHHESEINYVLNNLYDTDLPWQADDYVIAAKMNAYWVNFIKTGNPNGGNLTTWYANTNNSVVQHVGDGWGTIPVADPAKVSLFERWFSTLVAY